MSALSALSLMGLAALLFFVSVSYLVGNRPGAGTPGAPASGEAELKRLGRKKLLTRLAFGYSALLLFAHRVAMTRLYLSMDFNDRSAQAGFGMSWAFLDPLAGFPIIFGTMPFTKDMPMPRFINGYYIPLSIMLYAAIIYGLWRLSRHAFVSPKPQASAGENAPGSRA